VFACDASSRCFVPIVLFPRKFMKLATILAPPADGAGARVAAEDERMVLDALTKHLARGRLAHRLTQPTNWSLFQAAPAAARTAPFGSYVLSLDQGSDAIWKRLHPKNRNVIRSAEKAGVKVVEGKDQLEAAFLLYRATMERNRLAHEPLDFVAALFDSHDFDMFCGVAYVDERPVAALLAPYNHHAAYYLLGGTAEQIEINGANNLLHFRAIQAFAARGAGRYDFVGARLGQVSNERLRGIQRFKSRFGAELHSGILWKQDLSPAICRGYDALVGLRNAAMKRAPALDIIDQERQTAANAHRMVERQGT
jgi:hypothetical protein